MRRLGIIIPTHDRAASLRRTLRSVLEQTYAGSPPEIVVVNNNSSDDTASIGAELDPRIRMIDEPRQGLSHARNTGIQVLGHWASLALQDHGARRRVFDERTPVGLIGANVAFRKRVFRFFSGFVRERCVCLARR